jgi:hypothetical protein
MGKLSVSIAVVFALALLACQGEKAGDPCDKFFQNTCKSPLTCVEMPGKKVCAGSCSGGDSCTDPALAPSQVMVDGPTGPLAAGCYCLPK